MYRPDPQGVDVPDKQYDFEEVVERVFDRIRQANQNNHAALEDMGRHREELQRIREEHKQEVDQVARNLEACAKERSILQTAMSAYNLSAQEVVGLQDRMATAEQDMRELMQVNRTLEQRSEAYDKAAADLAESRETISRLREELRSLEQRGSGDKDDLLQAKRKIGALEQKLTKTVQQQKRLAVQWNKATAKADTTERQLIEQRSTYGELQYEMQVLSRDHKAAQKRVRALEADADAFVEKYERRRKKVTELSSRIDTLEGQLRAAQHGGQDQEAAASRLQKALNSLQEKFDRQVEALQQCEDRVTDYHGKFEGGQIIVERLLDEKNAAEAQAKALREEMKTLRAAYERDQATTNRLRKEQQRMLEFREELQEQFDTMVQQVEAKQRELEEVKQSREQCKRDLQDARDTLAQNRESLLIASQGLAQELDKKPNPTPPRPDKTPTRPVSPPRPAKTPPRRGPDFGPVLLKYRKSWLPGRVVRVRRVRTTKDNWVVRAEAIVDGDENTEEYNFPADVRPYYAAGAQVNRKGSGKNANDAVTIAGSKVYSQGNVKFVVEGRKVYEEPNAFAPPQEWKAYASDLLAP